MTTVLPTPPGPVDSLDAVQERLDEPVVLVPRMVWALLTAVLLAVAGTVTWLVAGSWPRHLDLPAVLAHGPGPVAVTAPVAGTVTSLDVTTGATVRRGDPLAAITRPDGTVTRVRADAAGVVAGLRVDGGDAVRAGSPLVALDRAADPATGVLLVHDRADLARLAVGRRVDLAVPGGAVTGRITGIDAVPVDAAALRTRFAVPLDGLPAGGTPVWVVRVGLPRGTQVPLGATDATVTLPSIRPYQLVFGDGS